MSVVRGDPKRGLGCIIVAFDDLHFVDLVVVDLSFCVPRFVIDCVFLPALISIFPVCRGYGYPWIYPWTFLFILIQMTDITILE